jgi:hypothetical protein
METDKEEVIPLDVVETTEAEITVRERQEPTYYESDDFSAFAN